MAGEFKQKITIQFQGAGKAEKGAKKVESSMGKLGKTVLKAGVAFFAARGIITGMQKAFSMASQAEALEKGFKKLGSQIGFTGNSLNRLSSAVDGTINKVDLMRVANQAMTLGVVGSEQEMTKMFDTAQRLGKSLGVDTVSALDSLITGMGRQSILMLDNLGIIVDTRKANEDYAESIGKTVDQLTDQEKKIAFNNAALGAAEEKVEILGAEQLGAADATAQFQVAVDELLITLGDSFLPVLGEVISGVTSFIKGVSDFFGLTPDVNDAIAEMDDALYKEESTLKRLMRQLRDENTTKDRKGKLIAILNSEYGKYTEHLLSEASSVKDIATYEEEVMAKLVDNVELKKMRTKESVLEEAQEKKLKEIQKARTEQTKLFRDQLMKAVPDADNLRKYLVDLGLEGGQVFNAVNLLTKEAIDGQREFKDVMSLTDEEFVIFLGSLENVQLPTWGRDKFIQFFDLENMREGMRSYNDLQQELDALTKRQEEFIQLKVDEGAAVVEAGKIISKEGQDRANRQAEWAEFDSEENRRKREAEGLAEAHEERMLRIDGDKIARKIEEIDAENALMEEKLFAEEFELEQEELEKERHDKRIEQLNAEVDRQKEIKATRGLSDEEVKAYKDQFAFEDAQLKIMKQKVDMAMAVGAANKHAGQAAADAAGLYITAWLQQAVATYIAKAFADTGFLGGLAATALASSFGSLLAQTVKSVSAAAEGMDEIITEPTLILAGEEGAEYVDIEPTTNEGAGRGGVNVTFTGNVLSRDFIEDEALPLIKEALRKGGDIGIS